MNCNANTPPEQGTNVEEYARFYASLGWAVFPVWSVDASGVCCCPKHGTCSSPGKHPRVKGGFHAATTNIAKLSKWNWTTANIGIATGITSGIIVIDIDGLAGRESYDALEEKLGPLVESGRPTVVATSNGGAHLYVANPEGLTIPSRTGIAAHVDIRADGGYVVAPPSLHASGHCYTFNHRNWTLPRLSPNWADFLTRKGCYTENPENSKRVQDITQQQSPSRKIDKIDVDVSTLIDPTELQAIINRTLPTPKRKRHDSIFAFARAIWSRPDMRDLSADRIEPLFQEWFKKALPLIGTKDYNESLLDFADAWEGVKYPEGFTPVESAWAASEHVPPPERAAQLMGDLPRFAAFCIAMQKGCGGTDFFLSCQDLASCINAKPMTASRILNRLIKAGLLERIRKGDFRTRHASEYRWIGGE